MFSGDSQSSADEHFNVMAGLVPAIRVFDVATL